MQDVRPTSRKRKSPATDKASTSRRAGKGRADGERSHKQRRVSHPPYEAPLLYPDATPHSPQPQREPSSSLGKLFAQEDGEPYKFYVQIDIRPRTKIADAIKVRDYSTLRADIDNLSVEEWREARARHCRRRLCYPRFSLYTDL